MTALGFLLIIQLFFLFRELESRIKIEYYNCKKLVANTKNLST